MITYQPGPGPGLQVSGPQPARPANYYRNRTRPGPWAAGRPGPRAEARPVQDTSPYHLSLASRVFSPNFPTCAVPLMYSFLILSILVTPNENRNIFNSATSISASCLFVSATVSNPYNIAGLTATLYTFPFTLAGTLLSPITPDILLSNKQYQLKMWPCAFLYFIICLPFCVTLIANYILLHTIWNNKYYYYFM